MVNEWIYNISYIKRNDKQISNAKEKKKCQKKEKEKRVARDKQTDLPKKYLSGLKGGARSERASLIKAMSEAYKKGQRIPRSMFRARARSGY